MRLSPWTTSYSLPMGQGMKDTDTVSTFGSLVRSLQPGRRQKSPAAFLLGSSESWSAHLRCLPPTQLLCSLLSSSTSLCRLGRCSGVGLAGPGAAPQPLPLQCGGLYTPSQGQSVKLKGGKIKTDQRRYIFIQRVIRLWNSLPQEVVEAKNIARFKEGLNVGMDIKNIQSYNS